jgi:hypothetical protein
MGAAEKALMSLPSPLTASDEWVKAREGSLEVIRLTAGLHRQVWVSGTNVYVDVHIANNSRKTIKKIELQLERDILCYKHVCLGHQVCCYTRLTVHTYRLPHPQERSLQARLGSSTTTSAQFSIKRQSSQALPVGMGFLRTKHTFVPATWKFRVAMSQSSAVCADLSCLN